MSTVVSCEHPVRLLHPSYLDFVNKFPFISIMRGSRVIFKPISPTDRSELANGISFFKVFDVPFPKYVKDTDDYAFLNLETGERQDMFIYVPCGKCNVCEKKKCTSYMQRMQLALEYDCNPPLFCTLTYNDNHLPSDGVSMKDIQNFKKRLNKLVYSFFPDSRLKYCFFSEYGKLGRPHYHGIIYGFPLHQLKAKHGLHYFVEAVRMIQYCWRKTPKTAKKSDRLSYEQYVSKGYKVFNSDCSDKFSFGFVNVSIGSSKCFAYITKYIGKGSNVPEGKNPNFHSFSINLGVPFVKSLKDYLFNEKRKLRYCSVQDGSYKEISLCSYYIKKLFPSCSTLVSPDIRRHWRNLHSLTDFFVTNSALPSWFRETILNVSLDTCRKFSVLQDLFPVGDYEISSSIRKQQINYAKLYYNDFKTKIDEVFSGSFDENGNSVYISVYHYSYDIVKDFFREVSFFDDLSSDFPNFSYFVYDSIINRDKFLSGYSDFLIDPVILSAMCRSNKSTLFSKQKLL